MRAPAPSEAVSPEESPTLRDIYRLRANYGVNLGSCFVLEKWIYHEHFIGNSQCELDVARALVREYGLEDAQSRLEAFWKGFMSDDDWNWLKNNAVTAVRIPLGYWNIDGGRYTNGTLFSEVAKIYQNSWSIFINDFVQKASTFGIGVLVDLHALPFGANGAAHSGECSVNCSAGFWSNPNAQLLTCEALSFVARELELYDNIVGIQVVNEADFSNETNLRAQYYSLAINSIRETNSSVPIIISDGWWPSQWVEWIQKFQGDSNLGLVLDSHCYRCFSDADKQKLPRKIINDLQGDFLTNLPNEGQGVDIMVGEYSCVLDEQSWDRDNANSERDTLVNMFGAEQQQIFQLRARFGSFFWTYKFQSGNGGEWDFKTMVNRGAVKPPPAFSEDSCSTKRRDSILQRCFQAHEEYWSVTAPGKSFDHELYKVGFLTAWSDAVSFALFNNSIVGRVQAWKASRLQEHVEKKGKLEFDWEWSHGFDCALREFMN